MRKYLKILKGLQQLLLFSFRYSLFTLEINDNKSIAINLILTTVSSNINTMALYDSYGIQCYYFVWIIDKIKNGSKREERIL